MQTIRVFGSASLADLENLSWVSEHVRYTGLSFDERLLYGTDNQHMNGGTAGLYQIPMQLARCLLQLRSYRISSIIDIGTFSGWTITLITAYLARFNPQLRVITVDIEELFDMYSSVRELLPIEYHIGKTSNDFRNRRYDLAIIDADHSYQSCAADYEAVGRAAAVCFLHDINDKFVKSPSANNGGVPRLWGEIVSKEFWRKSLFPSEIFEYLDHSAGDHIMGIGLVARDWAGRRQSTSLVERFIMRRLRILGLLVDQHSRWEPE